jgi:hypothetical protein
MKKVWLFLLVLVLCVSFSGVALAKSQDLTVTDSDGNPVDWISFKLHPSNELTKKVDTIWVNPLQDWEKEQLYAAAEAVYPGETVIELGGITMNGYDDEYDYIFDYFGPFTAKVYNPDIHNGDKVAVFIFNQEEEIVFEVKAFRVKEGTFSFRDFKADYMGAYCVYVILN